MPIATTHYVTWISRGRRHHGSAYADIASPTQSSLTAGDTFQTPWASPSISWVDTNGNMHTANFAFWSVTGGVDGGVISNAGSNIAPSVTVGSSDIVATAWYIEGGPGGNGQPGVYIDAFDVNQGMFVDDDFVDVITDSSFTAAANNDGFVPSATAEDVEAFSSFHSVPFESWQVVLGTETVMNRDLQVAVNSNAVAFAFYKTPVGIKPPQINERQGIWVSWGVMVDGGGPTGNGPIGPWDPMAKQFAVGLALADAAKIVDSSLENAILEIAAKQISLASKEIQDQMLSYNKTQQEKITIRKVHV